MSVTLKNVKLGQSKEENYSNISDNFVDLNTEKVDRALKTGSDSQYKVLSDENFTADEKTKLGGVEAHAQVNVQPDWNQTTNTSDDFIKNKPTMTSQFVNNGSDNTSRFVEADESLKNPNAITITYNGNATPIIYDGSQAKNISFYAPNTPGTTGQFLISKGAGVAPEYKSLILTDIPDLSTLYLNKNSSTAQIVKGNITINNYDGNGTNNAQLTLNGTLNINGNIYQNGTAYETHAEKVYTKQDIIITRDGATGGLSAGEYTGIQAKKYDGTHDGQLVFDNLGVARVGDIGQTQPLATRDESENLTNNGLMAWDSTNYRLKTRDLISSDIPDLSSLYVQKLAPGASTVQTVYGYVVFDNLITGNISGNAETATNALNDSSGDEIALTYVKKTRTINGYELNSDITLSDNDLTNNAYVRYDAVMTLTEAQKARVRTSIGAADGQTSGTSISINSVYQSSINLDSDIASQTYVANAITTAVGNINSVLDTINGEVI